MAMLQFKDCSSVLGLYGRWKRRQTPKGWLYLGQYGSSDGTALFGCGWVLWL